MAENSKTTITLVENIKVDDEKSIKNGDLHVPEAPAAHLENGDIKKIPEEAEPTPVEEISKEESTNVAENQVEIPTEVAVEQVIDEVIKEEIELTGIAEKKESESKIIEEVEEGDHEITRSFEVIEVDVSRY